MERHHTEIQKAGLQLIVAGQGEPKHAERYCGKLAPSVNCLVRSDTAGYDTYGMERGGVGALLNPNMFLAGVKSVAEGHFPGEPTGDVAMMPGTFIVDTEGKIRFAYYSSHAADHPEFKDVFAAVKQP